MTLADRFPGEIVTLGIGQRVRILWHAQGTTFVGLIDDFFDAEDHRPRGVPSCVGISTVDLVRPQRADNGAGARGPDPTDPLHRTQGAFV